MKKVTWDSAKEKLLISRYPNTPNKVLADEFEISEASLKKKAWELGLRKEKFYGLNTTIAYSIRDIGVERYSYSEIAAKIGCHRNTVKRYVTALVDAGIIEACSVRQVYDKISRIRQTIIKKERGRVIFGMDQRTDIKVFASSKKMEMRKRLRIYGYMIERGSDLVLICPDTDRHPKSEAAARRLGLTFDLDWESFEAFSGEDSAEEDVIREASENI